MIPALRTQGFFLVKSINYVNNFESFVTYLNNC
jgi:hypothetical protein